MITIQKASKKDYKNWLSVILEKTAMFEKHFKFLKTDKESDSSLKSIYYNNDVCGYVVLTQESDNFKMQGLYIFPDFYSTCNISTLFKEILAYIKGVHPSPCTLMFDRSLVSQIAM